MECSYGIISLRRIDKKWETLLVKHRKGHWAFPKGHPDLEELPQETASRELYEETALHVVCFLPVESLKEFYVYKRKGASIEKTVTYFLAEVEGEVQIQAEEIEAYRWVLLEDAVKLATFPETKKLVHQVAKQLLV